MLVYFGLQAGNMESKFCGDTGAGTGACEIRQSFYVADAACPEIFSLCEASPIGFPSHF